MVAKPSTTLVVVAVIVAALLAPKGARAIEVKKSLYSNPGPSGGGNGPSAPGPTKENPIPTAMRQQLSDTIASESDIFLNEESEKKSSGKGTYVDLEHAKFMYIPAQKAGKWNVQAKLQAAEYTPSKSGEGKGKPTGKQRVLIFNYRLDGSKWSEVEPPKWEDVADASAPAAAAKK
jgi:hypothetical protein